MAHDDFGTAVVRAELPPWFYSAWSIAGLAPLVKAQLSPEQVRAGREVDMRPVAVGEVDLRAMASYLARDCREASVEVLAPQQLAVGGREWRYLYTHTRDPYDVRGAL